MKQSNKTITAAAAIAAAAGLAIAGAVPGQRRVHHARPRRPARTAAMPEGGPRAAWPAAARSQDPSRASHPGETLLTGTLKDKVTAAARAREPGATIERVETDAEGVYEAHMVRADGTHITVQVDKSFAVTAVQTGGPGGGRPGGPAAGRRDRTGPAAAAGPVQRAGPDRRGCHGRGGEQHHLSGSLRRRPRTPSPSRHLAEGRPAVSSGPAASAPAAGVVPPRPAVHHGRQGLPRCRPGARRPCCRRT